MSEKSRNISLATSKDARKLQYEEARREFWKLNSVSNYASNFGSNCKTQVDTDTLKNEKLSNLPYASSLKLEALEYLQRWLNLNDIDEFSLRIFTILRDIYTVIKSLQAPTTLGSEYKWITINENARAPRFDKLIEKHRNRRFAAVNAASSIDSPSISIERSTEGRGTFEKMQSIASMTFHGGSNYYSFIDSPLSARNAKQKFLEGSGQITNHCHMHDPKITNYQETFLGRQKSKDKLDIDWKTSVFVGAVSPDP